MSDKRGESLEVARLLARAFNAYNHVTEPSATADNATLETMTGEAFRLSYDGRWYLVLVWCRTRTHR